MKNDQWQEHYKRRSCYAQQITHLHFPGRSAEYVTNFQILQHFAGNRSSNAHNRGNAKRSCNTCGTPHP